MFQIVSNNRGKIYFHFHISTLGPFNNQHHANINLYHIPANLNLKSIPALSFVPLDIWSQALSHMTTYCHLNYTILGFELPSFGEEVQITRFVSKRYSVPKWLSLKFSGELKENWEKRQNKTVTKRLNNKCFDDMTFVHKARQH